MSAKSNVKMLLFVGVFLYIVSFYLIYMGAYSDEMLIGGYVFAALGTPLLILIFSKYIAVHKTEKSFLILVCVGIGGIIACAVLWLFGVKSANAQWDNLINNLFTLLSGACITCIFEACNNASAEIEEALKNTKKTK